MRDLQGTRSFTSPAPADKKFPIKTNWLRTRSGKLPSAVKIVEEFFSGLLFAQLIIQFTMIFVTREFHWYRNRFNYQPPSFLHSLTHVSLVTPKLPQHDVEFILINLLRHMAARVRTNENLACVATSVWCACVNRAAARQPNDQQKEIGRSYIAQQI